MPEVVLLHGFTGSPGCFSRVCAALPKSCTAVAPPILGHHPTLLRPGGGFLPEVDRIAHEIRRLTTRPVHLCGYSMGARLALGLLVSYPALFRSATLIGVHPGLSDEAERQERRAADAAWVDRLRRDGLAAFVAAWEDQPLFRSQVRLTVDQRAQRRAVRLGQDAAGLCLALSELGLSEMPDFWSRISGFKIPIHILVGATDEKFVQIGRRMRALLPAATLEEVPSVGHDVVLEAPQEVASAISAQLRGDRK